MGRVGGVIGGLTSLVVVGRTGGGEGFFVGVIWCNNRRRELGKDRPTEETLDRMSDSNFFLLDP